MHLFHDIFRTKLYSVNVSLFTNESLGPNKQPNTLGVKISQYFLVYNNDLFGTVISFYFTRHYLCGLYCFAVNIFVVLGDLLSFLMFSMENESVTLTWRYLLIIVVSIN